MSNSTDGRSVTSKLAAILRTFSSGDVHSLSEIARSAGIPVSTAHRLATELAAWGVLERTEDRQYRVGTLLALIGSQPWHEPNVHEHARRVLDDLCSATHTTARLGVLDEDLAVSYVEKQPNAQPVPTAFEKHKLPAHATAMGKALLAFSPPEIVNMVIENGLEAYTPFTIVTPQGLRRALAVARMTRVATARQELRLNTAAVAVPVFGSGGSVVAALELTTSGVGTQLHLIQSAVVIAARALSRELATSQCRNRPSRSMIGNEMAMAASR
jgi:DNA-binding IclR family transcriptional regulator